MNLIKSITVYKKFPNLKREVRLRLYDANYSNSGDLSELELDSISEIIEELETLVNQNNPKNYVEWGVDLFSVLSYPQVSKCKNSIEDINFEDVSTLSLLHFLKELELFKKKCSESEILKDSVGKAFQIIKNNPSDFKKWEDGYYYEIQIDDVVINLNLSKEDFDYSIQEYLDQIEKIEI
ncbi:cysteinyl-tRNA synthetase [Flavobacterium sp. 28YEA47A]|uniref:hypothetical protein n=1 Tax=Flavobacterium sp. 28YEA47A TaxID=3156276 RepID=UPI003516749F